MTSEMFVSSMDVMQAATNINSEEGGVGNVGFSYRGRHYRLREVAADQSR